MRISETIEDFRLKRSARRLRVIVVVLGVLSPLAGNVAARPPLLPAASLYAYDAVPGDVGRGGCEETHAPSALQPAKLGAAEPAYRHIAGERCAPDDCSFPITIPRSLPKGRAQEVTTGRVSLADGVAAEAGAGIRFGQQGVSAAFRHGEFAGRTIEEVAGGLRSGAISPSQLPIQTITREGVTYTLNNRSLMALRQAGLQPTVIQDVTGNPFFEGLLTQRLGEMGGVVPPGFVPVIR